MLIVTLGLSAFAIALASGALGVGGGVLLVPALLYLPPALGLGDLGLQTISGLGAVQIACAGLAGAATHRLSGTFSLAAAGPLVVAGVAGAAAGSLLAPHVGRDVRHVSLAVLVSAASLLTLRRAPSEQGADRPRRGVAGAVALGLGVGFAVGLLGAGVFLVVPGSIYVLRHEPRTAVGTALAFGLAAGSVALLTKTIQGGVPGTWIAAVAAGALLGAPAGAIGGRRLKPRSVRFGFAILTALVAARLWADV